MRILLIISDLRGGGAQKVVLTLAHALRQRDHEVHVLLMEHVAEYEIPEGIFLHSLVRPGAHMSSGWVGKRTLAWMLRRWFRKNSAQHPFDLTTVSLPFACEIASLAGIGPVWHHIHNSLGDEIERLSRKNSFKAARRRRRYQSIFKDQNLIAVSNGIAHNLRQRLGLRPARVVTMYNMFDLSEIRRLAALPDPQLPARPYIVHAGRFVPQKRHDLLLEAYVCSGIPHDLILLTKERPELVDLVNRRGLAGRVTITGFKENPYPWYAKASALVLSSDYEGFCNVIVEALACGTPVVSTDCPYGPNEILIGSLSRWLSPPGDAEALARNLRDIIANPPSLEDADLQRFSLDSAALKVERLINDRSGRQFEARR